MQGKRNAKKRSLVLLSADGSEEKVYKKTTVANPTSCFKKKKGHQIRQLRETFGHSFGPCVCGNLKELIFKCLGGCQGGGGKGGNVEAMN